MIPCRLIVDPPQAGAWNMALDEALLDEAAGNGEATLRFYQWSEPTLSLGYFQSTHERFSHPPSLDAAVVRRISGGGALMHDRELTYSLCLPAGHPLARQSSTLYEAVHGSLISALSAKGVALQLVGELASRQTDDESNAVAEPFLCFARRTHADVVRAPSAGAGSMKIVGSAQRRRRGAVLQHGAVLIAASPLAPELAGLVESAGLSITPEQVTQLWQPKLAFALELDVFTDSISASIREAAQRLRSEKYDSRLWTDRR
jgi:lipoate-protein ligase A